MENGDFIMGKFRDWFRVIVFPITIIFCVIKLIWRLIDRFFARKFLKNIDIRDIDGLDGLAFEEFLYQSFRNIGVKVSKTRSSGDYGADLVLNLKNGRIVIQSKLYYNHNVGNSAVQEVASARNYYNADSGVVITNSYFTKAAINLADATNIKLIDRNMLQEFLSSDKSTKLSIINEWQI